MKLVKFFALAAIVLSASTGAYAKDIKDWHDGFKCKDCHDQGMQSYPSDQSCLQCHDVDDLADATKRSGDEEWQNPHNNLHYGKELPCVECHSEHQEAGTYKPLCLDCHTFKYEKFKG